MIDFIQSYRYRSLGSRSLKSGNKLLLAPIDYPDPVQSRETDEQPGALLFQHHRGRTKVGVDVANEFPCGSIDDPNFAWPSVGVFASVIDIEIPGLFVVLHQVSAHRELNGLDYFKRVSIKHLKGAIPTAGDYQLLHRRNIEQPLRAIESSFDAANVLQGLQVNDLHFVIVLSRYEDSLSFYISGQVIPRSSHVGHGNLCDEPQRRVFLAQCGGCQCKECANEN